jgi:hypothetical protein
LFDAVIEVEVNPIFSIKINEKLCLIVKEVEVNPSFGLHIKRNEMVCLVVIVLSTVSHSFFKVFHPSYFLLHITITNTNTSTSDGGCLLPPLSE